MAPLDTDHVPQAALGKEVQRTGGGARSAGHTTKIVVFRPKGLRRPTKTLAISDTYETNSLLSGSMEDQWNFFTDQRIKGALSTEKQWNWREPEKKDMWSSVSGRFPDGEGRPPWQKSFPVEARPRRLDQICGLKLRPVSFLSFDPPGRREPGSRPARTMAV
jgi:hypothetical protein